MGKWTGPREVGPVGGLGAGMPRTHGKLRKKGEK